MIFYLPPEGVLEHTWEFFTDVIISYNGNEQRLAITKQPKQKFNVKIVYHTLTDLRQIRADLYLNTHGGSGVYMPLWHEAVRITDDAAVFGTSNNVAGDFSLSDIAAGDKILVVNLEGEYQLMTVATIGAGFFNPTESFDDHFPRGSFVCPAELVYVRDNPQQDVYPITGGEVSVNALMTRQPAIVATGGSSYTNYSSKPVITPRPVIEGSGKFNYDRLFFEWETENNLYQDTATPFARVISQKKFLVKTKQERQNWKKFFLDIAGGRETFWVPTWQSDLAVVDQPTSTTIKISKDLNYKVTYYDTNAIKNLMLIYNDGTVAYRSVTGVVINGDSTQTLTLNSAYTNGSVRSVSFLELSRLEGGTVSWAHYAGYSVLKFMVTTVRS